MTEHPYDILAERLGATPDDVLSSVARLQERGIIRRLGPVFASSRLGYASTLVAARIPPTRLHEVADVVSQLPGVTHNYQRDHSFNIWFTFIAPSREEIEANLEEIAKQTGVTDIINLPATRVFKIKAKFEV